MPNHGQGCALRHPRKTMATNHGRGELPLIFAKTMATWQSATALGGGLGAAGAAPTMCGVLSTKQRAAGRRREMVSAAVEGLAGAVARVQVVGLQRRGVDDVEGPQHKGRRQLFMASAPKED